MILRSPRGVFRLLAGLTAALTLGALVTPTASADPAKLVITASVDEGVHLVGKPFPITVTVHNASPDPLTGVTVTTQRISGSDVSIDSWGDFYYPGTTLAAGETRTLTLTARVYNWQDGPTETAFTSWTIPSWEVQPAAVTIPVLDPTTHTGSLHGVLYGDRNDNKTFDPGEELAGAPIQIYGDRTLDAVTGADGSFTFADLPARYYQLYWTTLPDGWLLADAYEGFDVTGDQNIEVRAVRPLSDRLKATASLDRDVYAPGDQVQVTFALTNTGSAPLSGITGGCDRAGDSPQHIQGWRSWSDLVYPASLAIGPGETRTFTETGTVPAVANQYGGFGVSCDFGPLDGGLQGFPTVDLWGRVPGEPGTADITMYHDDNKNLTQDPGEAIAGTETRLVEYTSGETYATRTSDSEGHVSFESVPAGRYHVELAGGWVPSSEYGNDIQVGTCPLCSGGRSMDFVRG